MPDLPPVLVEIIAKADKFKSGMEEAGKEAEKFEGKSKGAFTQAAAAGKLALGGIATMAIGVGVTSVKMAADFQESMTLLQTGAGESEENMKMVKDGILDMAGKVGISADNLAKGMFLVESSGQHGAEGLKVLQAAAQGASASGADLSTVANGLTTVLTDYDISAGSAALVTSKLVTTVGQGKTTMQDLSASMSVLAPVAKGAGISLDQMLGAMATMTGEGISATEAAQQLAGTIRSLGNPTSTASAAMAAMGFNSTEVASQLGKKGLTGTLEELSDAVMAHMGPDGLAMKDSMNQSKLAMVSAREELEHLPPALQKLGAAYLDGKVTSAEWGKALKGQDAISSSLGKAFATTAKHALGFTNELKEGKGSASTYNAQMAEMTGGATGAAVSLALAGDNAETFNKNVATIAGTANDAGGSVKGFNLSQEDFNSKMKDAKAAVGSMAIKLGDVLIPIIEKTMMWISKHKDLVEQLAIVIGVVATSAIVIYIGKLTWAAMQAAKKYAMMAADGAWWVVKTLAQFAVVVAKAIWWATSMIAQGLIVSIKFITKMVWEMSAWVVKNALAFTAMVAKAAWWATSMIAQGAFVVAKFIVQMVAQLAGLVLKNAVAFTAMVAKAALWAASTVASWVVAGAGALAGAAVQVGAWVGVAAAATAAFIAENIASLGIIAGVALLIAAIIWLAKNWHEVWNFVKEKAEEAWHFLDDNVIHPIERAFHWVVAQIKEHWGLILGILTGPIGMVVVFIAKHFDQIVGFVKDIPKKIEHVASSMWDGIKNSFKSVINWLITKWNGLSFSIPKVHIPGFGDVGGATIGTPKIPLLAKGGNITGAGNVIVGDAGPEMLSLPVGARVTPLTGKTGGVGGGQTIIINVAGTVTSERDLVGKVRTALLQNGRGYSGMVSLG